ncbi:MAG: PAS domain S-box protein, partial [Chloroflexales bacterium]
MIGSLRLLLIEGCEDDALLLIHRALIERVTDLIVVLSADGIVHDVSPAITSTLGYRHEGLIGRSITAMIHPNDRDLIAATLSDLAAGAQLCHPLTLRALHMCGGQHTLEITATSLLADSAVFAPLINARDLIRQAEVDSQVRRHADRAESLVRLASRLNTHLDQPKLIAAICEEAARSLCADMAYVILADPSGPPQIAGAAGSGVDVIARMMPTMPTMLGQLLVGVEPLALETPGSTSRELVWRVCSAPMTRDDRHIGALVVAFADDELPISADSRALLGAIADQAGMALHNAELLAELRCSNAALADAYDATLEGWVHALDLRDQETEGHTRRTTALTLRIARAMGFDDEALTHIYRGALLHD